jgi:hypothetical protein
LSYVLNSHISVVNSAKKNVVRFQDNIEASLLARLNLLTFLPEILVPAAQPRDCAKIYGGPGAKAPGPPYIRIISLSVSDRRH